MANGRTVWQKTLSGSKAGFDKLWGWTDKLGAPVNRLSNKLGSEAFWPTTLDKESDKAARILRSFCKDGFYDEIPDDGPESTKKKQKQVLKKIPAEVIKNAKGLAIFTTMRTGLWISGAGGSGVLVARLPDGTWSPPSGLMLHTAGVGFLAGIDIYDCVMVINTEEALAAFEKVRCTIGGELSAVAGPIGIGGVLESEVHKRQAPIFTYLKSRGFYAGFQVDGTILIERSDENERFYGYRVPVREILAGQVRHPPREIHTLMQTIKAAQGDSDVNESLLPTEAPPSDYEIQTEAKIFGVPDRDDPDPYGVLALEKEGFLIREAGSHRRPSWDQFSFNPSPSSPIFNTFKRDSFDGRTPSRRSSWRTSTLSTMTSTTNPYTDRTTQTSMADTATQTDGDIPASPISSPSKRMAEIPEETSAKPPGEAANLDEVSSTTVIKLPLLRVASPSEELPQAADTDHSDYEDDAEDDAIIEEPAVVHEVQRATSPQVIARARVVQVPKKPQPPALPARNPTRDRQRPLVVSGDAAASVPASPPPLPKRDPAHSRASSISTFREHEQASSHRSVSEDSFSSVEHLNGLEKHLQKSQLGDKHADSAEDFHSVPTTPAAEMNEYALAAAVNRT